MPSTLPQELIDLVVDELRNDPVILRECSYVSSSFRRSGQKCLFYHIRILPPLDDERPTLCQKLYDLLKASTHIAPYVKCMEVIEGHTDTHETFNGPPRRPWITVDQTLALILPLLRLRQFSLRCYIPVSLLASQLPTSLKASFRDVLRSPTLTSLDLGQVILTPSEFYFFLKGCTGLKELSLFNVAVYSALVSDGDQKETEVGLNAPRSQLESLTIADSHGEILEHLLSPRSPMDLRYIHTLSLFGHIDAAHLDDLLQRSDAALQHLSLREPYGTPMDFVFKPNQCPNLRTFYIAVRGTTNWARVFQNCSAGIEKLTLELSHVNFSKLSGPEWKALDKVLARFELRSLREFTVKVHPGYPTDPSTGYSFAQSAGNVRRHLRALVSRSLLEMEPIPKFTRSSSWTIGY
ncbi:hypothetical protein B0H10DRAFT_2022170 [Mycena sp. CBHHK59/15]|nr:hypothetical protein B0H10DRAFT_2022170 [Mycena sp. CBHHK59/15]